MQGIGRNIRETKGKDYTVLETEGRGHYVGTVLAVRTRSPAWFGEGDEKSILMVKNSFHLGHRDWKTIFFLPRIKENETPYFGVPYFDQWGIVGGHTSAYRWHINDPIVFNKGIKALLSIMVRFHLMKIRTINLQVGMNGR